MRSVFPHGRGEIAQQYLPSVSIKPRGVEFALASYHSSENRVSGKLLDDALDGGGEFIPLFLREHVVEVPSPVVVESMLILAFLNELPRNWSSVNTRGKFEEGFAFSVEQAGGAHCEGAIPIVSPNREVGRSPCRHV